MSDAMTIDGLVVCVNYADLLAKSLAAWMQALDSLTVVTTPEDEATRCLAHAAGWGSHGARIHLHLTTVFTADGATFNKAAAMQQAIDLTMPWREWILLLDGDIVPPPNLRELLELEQLVPGHLYGGVRHLGEPADAHRPATDFPELTGRGQKIPGAFQLFHVNDAYIPADRSQLLNTTWKHAGCYDTEFQRRWPRDRLIRIDSIHYLHLGVPGTNWWGRTDPEIGLQRRQAMLDERARRGGSSAHERIGGEPT